MIGEDDERVVIQHEQEIFEMILRYVFFIEEFEHQYSPEDVSGFEINPTKIFLYKEISWFNNKCPFGHQLKLKSGSQQEVCVGCQDKDDIKNGKYFKR